MKTLKDITLNTEDVIAISVHNDKWISHHTLKQIGIERLKILYKYLEKENTEWNKKIDYDAPILWIEHNFNKTHFEIQINFIEHFFNIKKEDLK